MTSEALLLLLLLFKKKVSPFLNGSLICQTRGDDRGVGDIVSHFQGSTGLKCQPQQVCLTKPLQDRPDFSMTLQSEQFWLTHQHCQRKSDSLESNHYYIQ